MIYLIIITLILITNFKNSVEHMDNLKPERKNIFSSSSISQISYVNEQSEFGGYSMAQKADRQTDYQIKIKGPQSTTNINNFETPIQRLQRLHYLQRQSNQPQSNAAIGNEEDILPAPERLQYKQKVTGYETIKDKFNDQQLLKAFKIIDITKDDVITQEDLTFILDYMKEDYTMEQVKQMIEMVSKDKKHVYFQNFKDIAKGQIIPLAAFKIPNHKIKSKSQIFSNLQASDLLSQEPSRIIQDLKNGTISYEKYEELKKGIKKGQKQQEKNNSEETIDKLRKILPLLTQQEYKRRKLAFQEHLIIANRQFVKKFLPISLESSLCHQQIANNLQINLKEAKSLYTYQSNDSKPKALLVLMQAITYSQLKNINKLQLSLIAINSEQMLKFQEVQHILQFLKGKDPSIHKKLKIVLNNRGLNINQPILKIDILQAISEYISVFLI